MTSIDPGWIGPRDPAEPYLDVGYADGYVANCTTHDMGDCPYHKPPEELMTEPIPGLTDAEKLAALETYLKVLDPIAKALRAKVTADMGKSHVEKVGAYLPDGTKLASVAHSSGRKTARVTDEAAALAWCLKRYPDEVQTAQTIRPAFLKMILDLAKVDGAGVDGKTGEVLPFIEVGDGKPYVTLTTTDEGVERMSTLAAGFAAMIEGGATPAQEAKCRRCGVTGGLAHDCETAGRIS